jgi:glycosyltransferase involved in cell wall biosynthesis
MTSDTLAIAHTEASLGWGGQEIRILRESGGMIARGHRVELFAPPESRILAEAPRYGVPARALAIGRKRLAGLAAMLRLFRETSFDIVNTHSSTDSWLAALAARGRRAPVILRTRHVAVPPRDDPATRWLYRHGAARIVTTGEALRRQIIDVLGVDPARIESIPTGVDPAPYAVWSRAEARRALGLAPELPLVGIVATIRSWKGHRYLVEALPLLARADAQLLIVGDGPERASVESLVDALALRDRVSFAGQQHDVAPWLAALDVFALPSYANEGVPQALLQAMFSRIPCVTTSAGAIAEVAQDGETATVVAMNDPRALAQGIDRALADPARARALAERAYALVSSAHTETTMLDRMEAAFRRALARG